MPRLTCPICRHAAGPRAENAAFPFCSERCRLIDLGRWLGEEYRFPDEAQAPAPAAEENPSR